jgi:glyoxylase-like metal-dependent hydrolase (beta-lactamase superfamily II)
MSETASAALAYLSAAAVPRAVVGLEPDVTGFYDDVTGSVQYLVADPITLRCAIIDPVLDFDPTSGATRTTSADRLLRHIEAHGLTLEWILDTHPHADHFSAAGYLKDVTGAPTAIGQRVTEVQKIWKKLYNLPETFPTDGSQWDHLFADGERFAVGAIKARALLSPGHTLCSMTYVVGDAAFVHDTVFMPDSGTARADFPGGDARQLWRSIQRILKLPDDTRLFIGHDYRPNGREARWESTVAAQKAHNFQLKNHDETTFVKFRNERDRSLPLPNLMLSALQVNIAGGRLPPPEDDGRRYLKIPLNAFPLESRRSCGPSDNRRWLRGRHRSRSADCGEAVMDAAEPSGAADRLDGRGSPTAGCGAGATQHVRAGDRAGERRRGVRPSAAQAARAGDH